MHSSHLHFLYNPFPFPIAKIQWGANIVFDFCCLLTHSQAHLLIQILYTTSFCLCYPTAITRQSKKAKSLNKTHVGIASSIIRNPKLPSFSDIFSIEFLCSCLSLPLSFCGFYLFSLYCSERAKKCHFRRFISFLSAASSFSLFVGFLLCLGNLIKGQGVQKGSRKRWAHQQVLLLLDGSTFSQW